MRLTIICLLPCIAIAILSCTVSEPDEVLSESVQEPIRLYLCPQQGCERALESLILSAQETVICAFFDLDSPIIIESLEKKAEEVLVKVLIDDTNKGDLQNQSFIRFDTSSQYSHNKFCVIDGQALATGSTNPTRNGFEKNKNNLLILHSKILAQNYVDEFEELWSGSFGRGAANHVTKLRLNSVLVENYFCPEDHCARQLKALISSANSSITFLVFSFTDWSIANELILADSRGVKVKGIFESQQNGKYSQYERLRSQGIDVILDNYKYKIHHKVFVIDKKITLLGSYNPTKSGNERNDENIVVIHDENLAQIFIKEYQDILRIS